MNIKLKIITIILCGLIQINSWLPSTPKTRIMMPLNESMRSLDNLKMAVQSLSSDVDTHRLMADNILLSNIQNIEEPDSKSGIIMILQVLLEESPLSPKEQYLSNISNCKTTINSNQYTHVSNITEQLYSYKKRHIELENKLSECKNKVESMDALVNKSIKVSENQLRQATSDPNINSEIINKYTAQFTELKNKLVLKTNIIAELKSTLDEKTIELANIQNDIIAKLSYKPEVEVAEVEEVAEVKEKEKTGEIEKIGETKRLKKIEEKAKKITELSRSLLSKKMQHAIKLLKNNQVEEAKIILNEEIVKDPNNYTARKHLAKIYIKEKNYDKALVEVNKGLESLKKAME